ncbi:hypothetical protein [Roseibium algae]|uniref:Uncharacterized protein n=1 Tax=Roseibium algae TaxID=3123038 RepID=A0ABU8TS63_9HYPH
MKTLKYILTVAVCFSAAEIVYAQTGDISDDFYIRSQLDTGKFNGYHQILTEPKEGYVQAIYCDKTFWVRKLTVLWTEDEAKAGRKLVVEENKKDNRKVFCEDPNRQVTLESIGMSDKEITQLREARSGQDVRPSRMNVISDAFKGFK